MKDRARNKTRFNDFLSVEKCDRLAAKKLAKRKNILDWINGGAETQSTVKNNLEAFQKIKIYQRVMTGISSSRLKTSILGREVNAPIFAAPMSGLERIYGGAQSDVIEACGTLGLACFIGHFTDATPEKLARKGNRSKTPLIWMSYITEGNEEKVSKLAEKAEQLGYAGFGITVDAPTSVKLGDVVQEWYKRHAKQTSVALDQVAKLRKKTSLPFIVKGIIHPDDATKAVEAGADAIVVSNHGGRILDYSPATIETLPKIVRSVKNSAEIYIDGGFRRGTDVLKALALGAKGVLIGRPVAWGLVTNGRKGVENVLTGLANELERTCWLAGFSSIREVNSSAILLPDSW